MASKVGMKKEKQINRKFTGLAFNDIRHRLGRVTVHTSGRWSLLNNETTISGIKYEDVRNVWLRIKEKK